MEELTIVRRTNGKGAQTHPTLKLEMNGNRFLLRLKAVNNIGLKHDDGVMFGFNYKEKKAYLFKDDEPDAFILRNKSETDKGLRFTSKNLMTHFVDCFGLSKEENNYYFTIDDKPTSKKGYLLTYTDKS